MLNFSVNRQKNSTLALKTLSRATGESEQQIVVILFSVGIMPSILLDIC